MQSLPPGIHRVEDLARFDERSAHYEIAVAP